MHDARLLQSRADAVVVALKVQRLKLGLDLREDLLDHRDLLACLVERALLPLQTLLAVELDLALDFLNGCGEALIGFPAALFGLGEARFQRLLRLRERASRLCDMPFVLPLGGGEPRSHPGEIGANLLQSRVRFLLEALLYLCELMLLAAQPAHILMHLLVDALLARQIAARRVELGLLLAQALRIALHFGMCLARPVARFARRFPLQRRLILGRVVIGSAVHRPAHDQTSYLAVNAAPPDPGRRRRAE